jgi:hypothetical protein
MVSISHRKQNKQAISIKINQMIAFNQIKLDPRISHHRFNLSSIDFLHLPYPHIIIDMAHVFSYDIGRTIKWNGYYDHECPNQIESTINFSSMPIRSIYIEWNNKFFASKKHLEISESGHIRTFIDCLEDAGFIQNQTENPVQILYKIIREIENSLMKKWRLIKNGVKASYAGGHFDEMYASFNIIDQIIDKLFANQSMDEILDFKTYTNYDEFNMKLNNPLYI